MNEAYLDGVISFSMSMIPRNKNPYPFDTPEWYDWDKGWYDAMLSFEG